MSEKRLPTRADAYALLREYVTNESLVHHGLAVEAAFQEHGLHRLEAGTLLDNAGSQTVLRRNGFQEIGIAPRYLFIAGDWRDHLLFQRLAEGPA